MRTLRFLSIPAARRMGAATILASALGSTSAALAQSAPPPTPGAPAAGRPLGSPGGPPSQPSPPRGAAACGPQLISPVPPPPARGPGELTGSIVMARPFLAQITTPDGRSVTLALHKGTVINPPGTKLVPGMSVAVRGGPQSDGTVRADRIDLQPPAPQARPLGLDPRAPQPAR